MARILKLAILAMAVLAATALFRGACAAADMREADDLFDKGGFQEALKIYDAVYEETTDAGTREKAFFRACESLAHLFRYGEAADRLLSREAPQEAPHRARFLVLKSEMLRNFLRQYSYLDRGDVIDEEGRDVFRLTADEVRAEIVAAYSDLWQVRAELIGMDLRQEGYFLDIEDADFGMYPTVFDYAVFAWSDFLLAEGSHLTEDTQLPAAEVILVEDLDRSVDLSDPPILLAAELMEEASRAEGERRREARERWKIRRLVLLLDQTHRFDLKALADDKTLYDKKDLAVCRDRARKILLKWMDDFDTKEARAEAGYEAAEVLYSEIRLQEVVDLCKTIEKKFGGTHGSRHAAALRSRIEMPTLGLVAKTVMPPGRDAFKLTTKNLKEAYFRVYSIDPEDLRDEYLKCQGEIYGDSRDRFEGWSGLLRGNWIGSALGEMWLGPYLSRPAHKEWIVDTGDSGDYQSLTTMVSPPPLEAGIYLVCASGDPDFRIGRSLLVATLLNVTDLVLVGTAGVTVKTLDAYYDVIDDDGPTDIEDEVFRFYTLDAETGQPVAGATIDTKSYSTLKTRDDGLASLSLPVRVAPLSRNRYDVDPLARFEESFSFWAYSQDVNYWPPNPLSVFIETDRPIYQPGHTVKAKVVVVRRTAPGFRSTGESGKVTFTARDPNGKEFFDETVQLGEFGSASVEFEIPPGRLLGRYLLHAVCEDKGFSNKTGVGFSVEEYKRPEFEIELAAAEEPWRYDEAVEITGRVTYYFGGPVPDAPVRYRIRRATYIPYFYRYWFGETYPSAGDEVATGDAKTDADGNFTISFTPTPPPPRYVGYLPEISRFTVEVEGRDSGGRTIEARQTYKAGKDPIYLVIEPAKGFFLEDEPVEIKSRRLTLNDTPAPGTGTYEVYALADTTVKPLEDMGYSPYRGYRRWFPPLDIQLKDVPNGERVAEGKIKHDEEGTGTIRIDPLPQGTYRVIETSLTDWGSEITQARIFVVARDTETAVPVNAYSVMLVEQDAYEVGEVARFILGSGLGSGIYHVEIWCGEHFLRAEVVGGGQPVRLIEMPVTRVMKGGFTIRWFGVKDLDVHYGEATVPVPWDDKKLEVVLDPFDDELRPGEDYKWGVRLRDADGKPARGEVLALMYDRSLEYYVSSRNPWLDGLYALRSSRSDWKSSVFDPYVSSFRITEGLLDKLLKAFRQPPAEPKLPGLRTARTWLGRGVYLPHVRGGRGVETEDLVSYAAIKAGEAAPMALEEEAKGAPAPEFEYEAAAAEVKAREKFAETAFFKPHIVTGASDGRGQFTFTAPEQVTSWRIKVFAFSQDVKQGTLTQEAVTKKDLMVRADLPRFFREKDKGTITAIVHNESDRRLKGEVFIDVTEGDETINEKLGLMAPKEHFDIKPHALATFDWLIEVPNGVSTYKVRVAAVTGNLSDAEERDLPILPSRQRLIESAFAVLSGSEAKTLEIRLKHDPTRINESMVLQIDPQLALSILNTIPFLIEYPYGCVEQILNRYVPLSIISEVYKEYPVIREAVSKIPERKTVTPPWEKDDPRRLITLMETPWVWQSEGRPVGWPVIDMLDPEVVAKHKEINLSKLKSAQLANGAFPWWPGGTPDPYMTLYVLAGLAEARRYGVEVPADMISRALKYVNAEIPLRLKPEERDLALVAFAAYVVTSFSPREFREAREGHEAASSWVEFLERYVYAMTPFGKAHLAYTYLRLGKRAKAEALLDMAMDGAREDPIAGVYWTPEKYSWVWYSDTVEKHAFFLRTLQELRPRDERIPGMVQWLLFSRKGTVWKSTKASVAAVYALLDYLNQQGALASDESFRAAWGGNTYSVIVKADDWLEEPLRWQETGYWVTPNMSSARIEKDGPGVAFASLTWVYSTDELPEPSQPGMLDLERRFYRRVKEGEAYHLKPIETGGEVAVGDQVEVHLKINTRSQFEYMHLKDLKAAGFEAETLLSGWRYDQLGFYEEPRHSLTNFFISWLPHGEYVLRYRLRPTKPGAYRIGAATLQSMYSPEMTAHSAGFIINVK